MTVEIDGAENDVSVDFVPTIAAHMPYDTRQLGFPRPHARWPSHELAKSVVEKGINLVPKYDTEWSLSFSEMEKELAIRADQPGELRKKVHKIMKHLFVTQWKTRSCLSTYELKVTKLTVLL